jgi:hypothetical protein
MPSQRLAIYVTLLPDSKTVEYYVVRDTGDGRSDLETDGCLPSWKLPSVLAGELSELLSAMTAEPSSSTSHSSR